MDSFLAYFYYYKKLPLLLNIEKEIIRGEHESIKSPYNNLKLVYQYTLSDEYIYASYENKYNQIKMILHVNSPNYFYIKLITDDCKTIKNNEFDYYELCAIRDLCKEHNFIFLMYYINKYITTMPKKHIIINIYKNNKN